MKSGLNNGHAMPAQPVRFAVVPAAGIGSRLLPATKAMPKEMLTIVDRPAIEYVMDEAFAAGVEHVVVVVGRNKGSIQNHFDRHPEIEDAVSSAGKGELLRQLTDNLPAPGAVSFVRQHNPLGLAHAVWCARHIVGDSRFAVMLPDMLYLPNSGGLSDLLTCQESSDGHVIGVSRVRDEELHNYGVTSFSHSGAEHRLLGGEAVVIDGMVEKPPRGSAPSNWGIVGRYLLQPAIFAAIEATEPGVSGEVQLTDAITLSMASTPAYAREITAQSYDCGTPVNFLATNLAFAQQRDDLRPHFKGLMKVLSDHDSQPSKLSNGDAARYVGDFAALRT